jgi:hypothetical protein
LRNGIGLLAAHRFKGDAAYQQRRQRLRIDLEAVGIKPHVDAAGMPPARALADILVVRRADEDRHLDAPSVFIQVESGDLPDLDAAIEDRRADIDRAQAVAVQRVQGALLVARHLRRLFQAGEFVLGFFRLAGIDADVCA